MKIDRDDLFDKKMKDRFKKELDQVPASIHSQIDTTLNNIVNKENYNMKKINKIKKTGIVAAGILCGLVMTMQTTFAQNLVDKIVRSLSLSNITILENKDIVWADKEIPKSAIGKVFDKDKNVVEKITLENKEGLYNADGEQVFDVDDDGILITEAVQRKNMEQNARENPIEEVIVKDPTKLNDFASFDVKLPSYLPEGFEFTNGEFLKEQGVISDRACGIQFTNSDSKEMICLRLRYITKGSESETSFNNIEEVTVNGESAIIGDEGIVWEYEGVRYLMYSGLGRDENIKIAESIK